MSETSQEHSYDLSTLDGLMSFLKTCDASFINKPGTRVRVGRVFCSECGAFRRVEIWTLFGNISRFQGYGNSKLGSLSVTDEQLLDVAFRYQCLQCSSRSIGLIYKGPKGPSLALLPETYGGMRTPHTPKDVAFYLDEASRSKSVGAYAAAIVMVRAGIEQILHEQGFTKRMLGPKIEDLEKKIEAISAGKVTASAKEKWITELDVDFLKVLKDLGNFSIHPGDAGITERVNANLDHAFLSTVEETAAILLYLIYEVPHEKNERLSAMKLKLTQLKK